MARSDGERINAALGSTDVMSVKCMGSDEYGPGQEVDAPPGHRANENVVFEASDSRESRSSGLWISKAPVWVKIGSEPVEVAVLKYEGEPRSRLQYSQGGEPNDENTATRVRFLPCGDKEPTWRGYAGAIASDAEPSCVTVVVQVPDDYASVTAIPLNGTCK